MVDWTHVHRLWAKWAPIYCAGGVDGDASSAESPPLKAALLINYDPSGPSRLMSVIAEQQGMKAKPAELASFLDFMKRGNYQSEFFFIGPKQYLVTSIHEQWFGARCVSTSEPAGEGVIVMQSSAFLLVAMYDGSIGSASRAMLVVDQFVWQLSRWSL